MDRGDLSERRCVNDRTNGYLVAFATLVSPSGIKEPVDIVVDLPNVYSAQVQGVANSVGTPYGPAFQSYTPAALSAIGQVQQGATLFRIGTLGQSQAAEAQFWSLQNPLTTPNYPGLYGIPPENVTNANFVETAILQP